MLSEVVHKLLHDPDKDAALRARLAQAHLDAQNHLLTCQNAWSDAVADEASGFGGSAPVDKAERELLAAKKAADKAKAALDAVDARHRAAAATSKEAQEAARWESAVKLAEARAKAAERLAKSTKEMAADYATLLRLTGDLTAALPVKPDKDGAHLWPNQIEGGVKLALFKEGCDWAASWTWGRDAIPEFATPYRGAVGLIQSWRDAALGRG